MRLISWNVNGLRACMTKGFSEFFKQADADAFCVQETKMQQEQANFHQDGYEEYWNSAAKKGYAGTLIYSRHTPLSVRYGLGVAEHDQEGRVVTLEYPCFFLVNVYTPNAQPELARLAYRMQWEDAFLSYVKTLDTTKPVVICGDLNVAHQEMDLKNPKTNRRNPGFSDEEREKMTAFLSAGFADSFRSLYPETVAYTWWSYRFSARQKDVGWRIDYFVVSQRLLPAVEDALIYADVYGSDHCPVGLVLDDAKLAECAGV